MRIDGRCHCGEISYEAEIDPEKVILCHCTDCQTISGGPYRANVPAPIDRFTMQGTPRRYAKTGDSGQLVSTAFCGTCGAALYSARGEDPPFVFLRLGAVAQRAELAPKAQGFCRSALPWAMDIRGMPQIPDRMLPPRR